MTGLRYLESRARCHIGLPFGPSPWSSWRARESSERPVRLVAQCDHATMRPCDHDRAPKEFCPPSRALGSTLG